MEFSDVRKRWCASRAQRDNSKLNSFSLDFHKLASALKLDHACFSTNQPTWIKLERWDEV